MKQCSDYNIREKISSDFSKGFIVEASAGTGKTTIMLKRLINLLKKGINIKKVAVITFTEKAAMELRVRLIENLLTQREKSPVPELIESALLNIDRAMIGTIHSFCNSILRKYTMEANLPLNYQVMDEAQETEFFNFTFSEWIKNEFFKASDPATEILVRFEMKLNTLLPVFKMLISYFPFILQHQNISKPQTPENLNQEFIYIKENLKSILNSLKSIIANPDKSDNLFDSIKEQLTLIQPFTVMSDSEITFNIKNLDIKFKRGRQGNYFNVSKLNMLRCELDKLKLQFNNLKTEIGNYLSLSILYWLFRFYKHYESLKYKEGLLSFDDLIVNTLLLLKNNESVAREIAEVYECIYVDEFQDTDINQLYIINILSQYKKPDSLFLVGDPKQSIYRFRGADIRMYKSALEQFDSPKMELLTLTENFRSSPHIINAINCIFKNIFCKSNIQAGYSPLSAFVEKSRFDYSVLIVMLTNLPDRKLNADIIRELEAILLSYGIKYLIKNHKLNFKDIVALFNTSTNIEIYEQIFSKHQIPYVAELKQNLFEQPEIISIVQTVLGILNPFDEFYLYRALRSPVLGISDQEILNIKQKCSSETLPGLVMKFLNTDINKKPNQTPIDFAFYIIKKYHISLHNYNQFTLLTDLLKETDFPHNIFIHNKGFFMSYNIEKLLELALLSQNKGESIYYFFLKLYEYIKNSFEMEKPIITELDSVKMMTIHKSKGLEFPVIALCNVNAPKRSVGSNVIYEAKSNTLDFRIKDFIKTKNFDEANNIEKEILKQEKIRLLYVALTRAKDLIILPYIPIPPSKTGKTQPLIQYLNIESILTQEFTKKIELDYNNLPTLPKPLFHNDLPYSSFKAMPHGTCPSHIVYNFSNKQQKIGEALHLLMKLLDFDFLVNANETSLYEKISSLSNLCATKLNIPREYTTVFDLAINLVMYPVFLTLIKKADYFYKEVPYSVFDDNYEDKGRIDLLIEINGKILIIDYKTSLILENMDSIINQGKRYLKAVKKLINKPAAICFFSIYNKTLYIANNKNLEKPGWNEINVSKLLTFCT